MNCIQYGSIVECSSLAAVIMVKAPPACTIVCVCVRRAGYTRFDDVMHILAAPKKLEFQIFREIFSFPFCCCHFVVAWIKIYNPMNTNALRKSQMITFAIKKGWRIPTITVFYLCVCLQYIHIQCSVCVHSHLHVGIIFSLFLFLYLILQIVPWINENTLRWKYSMGNLAAYNGRLCIPSIEWWNEIATARNKQKMQ